MDKTEKEMKPKMWNVDGSERHFYHAIIMFVDNHTSKKMSNENLLTKKLLRKLLHSHGRNVSALLILHRCDKKHKSST